jgi:DNA-binding transcriptional MerR regulator
MENPLPPIPAKRYFTIGEVSELCDVKPYVLRYWEQEFTQLKPVKRRGNRRYYQHHEVLLIRRIRDLLYGQGFTISGARNQLGDLPLRQGDGGEGGDRSHAAALIAAGATSSTRPSPGADIGSAGPAFAMPMVNESSLATALPLPEVIELAPSELRAELLSIRALLVV